ncbi:unnamed protein product [Brassica oleracea var. botrytis]|uniref:(rape) hypothetical protein n=1 Tax=Brassica napus TaxID=3708 RepID=A0A816KRC8_BRANA|nr:unnamed protein product [Brassica napus]
MFLYLVNAELQEALVEARAAIDVALSFVMELRRLWKLKRSKPTLITRHAAAMITVFSAAESVTQRSFRTRVKNLFGYDEATTAAKPERCAGGRIVFPCRSRLVSSFPSVVSLVI